MSCQLNNKCLYCKYVIAQQIDLRTLVLYTQLTELWNIFKKIILISPFEEYGFTLVNAEAYLKNYNFELIQVTHEEFWNVMTHFLERMNEKFLEKKKIKMEETKRKLKR